MKSISRYSGQCMANNEHEHQHRQVPYSASDAIKVHRTFSPQYTLIGTMDDKNLSGSSEPHEISIIPTIHERIAHRGTI